MMAAILYFAFSGIVPIHHLYLTVFPYWITIAQEVMTYGVVVPSIMTFFNLWATTKGVKNVRWSVPAAFAAIYLIQPLVMRKGWYSKRFAWLHFWLTLIGAAGISIFMDDLGLDGILRRSMTFPLVGSVPLDEVLLTVSALIFGL